MWHKDLEAEQILNKLNIKFKYVPNIKISGLKVEESKKNNARFYEPIKITRSADMAQKMREGTTFPAIVITEAAEIMGGNHRIDAAIKAGLQVVDAYVALNPTPQQIDEFIRVDNTRHGENNTDEEKTQHAVSLYFKWKSVPGAIQRSMTDLAAIFFPGRPEYYDVIRLHCSAYSIQERLSCLGVEVKDKKIMCTSTLASLSPISDLDNVLKSVGHLITQFKLTGSEVSELVKNVKNKGTEKERLCVIDEWRKKLQNVKTGKKNKPETNLFNTLTRIKNSLLNGNDGNAFPTIDAITNDQKTRKKLKAGTNEIINMLRELKKGS